MAIKIGIIGGGAAGMGAAHRLVEAGHDVHLFEVDPRLGGDCFGVDMPMPDGSTRRIDAGVSDFNMQTFVKVKALLDELKLEYYPITQNASFSYPDGDPVYAFIGGQPHFAQEPDDKERFLSEIARFRRQCVEVLEDERYTDWTLQRWLDAQGYSQPFRDLYLYPRAIGAFPMPNTPAAEYRVRTIVAFWRMHGIVGGDGPAPRMCVKGGMYNYCDAFQSWFVRKGGQLHCSTRVVGVARRVNHIELRAVARGDDHITHKLDHVVFATNSNEVIPLIEDATDAERAIYDEFPYQRARLSIHQDTRLMPNDRAYWAAYNYVVPRDGQPEVYPIITFYPNQMLSLDGVPDVFVTMNPHIDPAPDKTINNRFFVHPVGISRTAEVARRIETLQGERNTWYAGSYLREPWVHEQALESGLHAADRLLAAV